MAEHRPYYTKSVKSGMTKTQETKKRRRKYPNVFFWKGKALIKRDALILVASYFVFFFMRI